jgi:hypothetical protein
MTTELDTAVPDNLAEATRELLARASALVIDHDAELAALLGEETLPEMPRDRAEHFYARILTLVREREEGPLDDEAKGRLAEEVREILDERNSTESVQLVERFGAHPHPVTPSMNFNGVPVAMTEGYVDIDTLWLWPENPRSELHAAEFIEVNNRPPTHDELLGIVTGAISLPGSTAKKDPFNLRPLARSIARKGVERPLIITAEGLILDGNRRYCGSQLVRADGEFAPEQKDRARWVRAWKLEPTATPDQEQAIVVALNFEDDYKEPWPEYVKARQVVDLFDGLCERKGAALTERHRRDIRKEVAKQFAISVGDVRRYVKMVRWADDFRNHHVDDGTYDAGSVRQRTNRIFQWFYEIDAGRGHEKLTNRIEGDDDLREVVYDLMWDVLDSGEQVRSLHKVIPDPDAYAKLLEAHKVREQGDGSENDRRQAALDLVGQAIDDATARRKQQARAKSGFDEFLTTAVARFGAAAPDDWRKIDRELLREVLRVCHAATGSIEGVLAAEEDPDYDRGAPASA